MGQSEHERERDREAAIASGPFSAGQIHKDSKHVRRPPPSTGAWGFDPNASARLERPSGRRAWSHTAKTVKTSDGKVVKSEGGPSNAKSGRSTSKKTEVDRDGDVPMSSVHIIDGGYISSDSEEDENGVQRVNVEDFGIVDRAQDDDNYDAYAPVRVMRVQHKKRTFGINAEGAKNQDGAIAIDANDVPSTVDDRERQKNKQKATADFEITSEKKVFQAAWSDSEDDSVKTKIKPDPEAASSSTIAPPLDSPPSSPDARRKGKERIKAATTAQTSVGTGSEWLTYEDRDENERLQADLDILRAELGNPDDVNGDATMTESERPDQRAEKVYLFQFPPVLPDLIPVSIKPDPEADGAGNDDPMLIDPPSTAPKDNTADKPIKIEANASEATSALPSLPTGALGQLHVHASGRVTLDWGGTAMNLGMGTAAGFLQDILCVNLPDAKLGDDGAVGEGSSASTGTAVSMGQVKGKFVVTPEWGDLV